MLSFAKLVKQVSQSGCKPCFLILCCPRVLFHIIIKKNVTLRLKFNSGHYRKKTHDFRLLLDHKYFFNSVQYICFETFAVGDNTVQQQQHQNNNKYLSKNVDRISKHSFMNSRQTCVKIFTAWTTRSIWYRDIVSPLFSDEVFVDVGIVIIIF